MIPERGQQVGRFMVLSRIGAGGMGVVFAAYDPKLDRKVALKLLRSAGDGPEAATASQMRLLREAQAMAQLSHPNVIAVYDVGTYESEVYIAMEFVEGETLTRWLRRWDRPWRDILDKFLAAGSALAKAHGGGLAHRDFKPDNVLVGHDERVRVMDFGLARSLLFEPPASPGPAHIDGLADAAHSPTLPGHGGNMFDHPLTKTGALVGTPRYMAPEQLTGQETDARSDQFSFCVALYEALYQQHPFEGETAQCLVKAPEATRPRPPPAGSSIPEWLHRALMRGLSAAAKDRFPSMDALLRALTPPVRQSSQVRFAVAAVVAVLGIVTSSYAVPALIGAQDDNEVLIDELQAAHDRIGQLQGQINTLITDIEGLEHHASQQREAVRKLRQNLNVALEQLEQAERDLSTLAEAEPDTVAGQDTPRPAQPGRSVDLPVGLKDAQVLAPLQPIPYELATCFREWVEREPGDRLLLAVELTIDAQGAPILGSRTGGIDDRVLHECVTFNLEKLRFPRASATSVVHYKFSRNARGKLVVSGDVVDVRGTGRDSAG